MSEDDDWEPGEELDDPEPAPASGRGGEQGNDKKEEAPKPQFSSLPDWVSQYLAAIYRRRLGGQLVWCSAWFKHPEAVSRLNAMWQEWEKAVVEHTMSNWWLYHADAHMNVLMSKDHGPFMTCKPGEHRTGTGSVEPLPVDTPDPGLFLSTAFSDPAPSSAPPPGSDGAETADDGR